jgi:hypothetical protein
MSLPDGSLRKPGARIRVSKKPHSPPSSPIRRKGIKKELTKNKRDQLSSVFTEIATPSIDVPTTEKLPKPKMHNKRSVAPKRKRYQLSASSKPRFWSAWEDALLTKLVKQVGQCKWVSISQMLNKYGASRDSRQCRERWFSHLNPSIDHSQFSLEEDKLLVKERSRKAATPWFVIARMLPGRTDGQCKNRYNSLARKGRVTNITTTSPVPCLAPASPASPEASPGASPVASPAASPATSPGSSPAASPAASEVQNRRAPRVFNARIPHVGEPHAQRVFNNINRIVCAARSQR